VSVRVRPLNDQELEKGSAWKVEGGKITALATNESSCYILDNVFDSTWTTVEVYRQTTKDVIKKVMGGINGTVFAYGQTSSGKTHTMRGTPSEPGIIPLAVNEIFDHIATTQDREFLLRVSYMEVRCTNHPWVSEVLLLYK
jgi:centromeric protein E